MKYLNPSSDMHVGPQVISVHELDIMRALFHAMLYRRVLDYVSERVSSCLTAHQHNTGYSVPLTVECWKDLYQKQ